jgi:hypothetical protein
MGIAVGAAALVACVAAIALATADRRMSEPTTTPSTSRQSVGGVPTASTQPLSGQDPVRSQAAVPTVTASARNPASPYLTYQDDRYGFQVQIPSLYQLQTPSGPDGVATFHDPQGRGTVTVFRRATSGRIDAAQAEALARANFTGAGGRVTYDHQSGHEYIVSGFTADHVVYYEFGYLGSAGEGGFIFTYPEADKGVFDAVVSYAYRSFQHGDL